MCQARSGNTCICDTKIFEREREGWGEEELRTNRNLQVLSQIQKVCAARELHVCAPL